MEARMQFEQSRSRSGISLVEVLVVIAILAVLAALVFPVFKRAKRAAKSVSCISNLRQFGVATGLYMADYDGNTPISARLWIPSTNTVRDPLAVYGVTNELNHCPDYSGDARVSDAESDYTFRFVILGVPVTGPPKATIWKINPEPNSVIAYCGWNADNPKVAVGDGSGGSISNGSINALRLEGSAKRVPTASIKDHQEDWGGFGSNIDPGAYRWLEFPDEPFPPSITQLP